MSSSLPRPFDTSLGNNFTASTCPQFFDTFLTNQTFQNCLPFSLLLQTSNSFFAVSRSAFELDQTLEASCNVNFAQCSAVMNDLANKIQQPSNCGADLQLQNPQVIQAYNGLLAYQPLYHAGCLTDSGGNFCYADAIANTSSPTSSYIYYLPLGVQLPAGTSPTCNNCVQNTMAIFATEAMNSSQPVSSDYSQAAAMVDEVCGPTFVDSGVKAKHSLATSLDASMSVGLMTLLALLFALLA